MTREELNTKKIGNIERAIRDSAHNLHHIPGMIETMIDKGFWKRFQIYTGEIVEPKNFAEFITSDNPHGMGMKPKDIEALIKDEPRVLTKWREAMKQKTGPKADNYHNNVMEIENKQGNTKAYTLARLEREAPQLFEQVCNKELSANAAAIKAGFRQTRTVYLSKDPAAAAEKIIEVLGDEYLNELRNAIDRLKSIKKAKPKVSNNVRSMGGVMINSGPLDAEDRARDVSESQWPALVNKRMWFSKVHLTHDCRCIVEFIEDAEIMWQELGYKSADDLIAKGYKLEPEEIRLVGQWLEINDPEAAVPLRGDKLNAIMHSL